MSPSAQRIAIAEACGWLRQEELLNDLNAMHKAERYAAEHLMNADQWESFGRLLEKAHPSALLKDTKGEIDYYDFATLMTEIGASQRAEAFLRAIGKWDDAL